MPRSIVLGNGNILVGLDKRGQVRDFYFPFVGLENHVGGRYRHRVGVWTEGVLSWLDDHSWEIKVFSTKNSLSSAITAKNEMLGVTLSFTDLVYNEKNIFIRRVVVKNTRKNARLIKIYFGQEFEIYESSGGDTAYFDPTQNALVHYKGKRVFLVNALQNGKPFDEYSTGVFNTEGKEGTYRDAEDGKLSKNPIEHGHADSVISLSLELSGEKETLLHYWICVAESVQEASALNQYLLLRGPEHLVNTTHDFWKAWVTKYNFSFHGLSEEMIGLFNQSLFYIRAHADLEGAIIASSDSDMFQGGKDTYSYMWPRDAAFSAMALDRAGDPNVAKRFFDFCNDVISSDGYFMHKYRPDRSLGSSWHPWVRNGETALPIQEDETALVIIALWRHYQLSRDLEFIESIYNTLIKKSALFMVSYRDPETGLPKPSYDLWEEKFGTHTFTSCSVYGALIVASKFAEILGKKKSQTIYAEAAEEIKEGIEKHLYDAKSGLFIKGLVEGGQDTTVDMSSVYGVYAFGVLPSDDPRVVRAIQETKKKLSGGKGQIGISRYVGDKYYRANESGASNSWFVTTLWLAEYYIAQAKNEKDLEIVKDIFKWVSERALPSGILSEQVDPDTNEQISATPLTWSHSAYVLTVLAYLDKLEEFGVCLTCNPVK